MSSFDKTVKLACKPKAAAPKPKYLDPIIAATWSDDGAVHDVCKALVSRIREPNAVVVFKALIVLHTMIRAGATDNVLGYLSSSNILKLRDISSANWEGYAAPQNLQNYALYLESRILAYKEIKHDAIKVQSDSNRDMRNSISIGENSKRGRKDRKTDASPAPTRSKTIMGRKLRSMTVEKGLLRETKVVHRMIDALVECRLYLDNLEDELTTTALQMLVKDLLILFQAGNEGVINVLEHYVEMSHVDAEDALKLYRRFCNQTENVVGYLGVARKLQNILNVPVPNLKHAPVSLAGALQEYLDDPNFEQNRIEYKMNKESADRGTKTKAVKNSSSEAEKRTSSQVSSEKTEPPSVGTSSAPSTGNQDGRDFFSAIEEEQPTIFNPQTNSSNVAYLQQPAANPFTRMVAVQPTGFLLPQATAVPAQSNPFGNFLTQPQPTGQYPLSAFAHQQPNGISPIPQQPQPTGGMQFPQRLLQPQMTGPNPFRQSMLLPQTTGMQLFGVPPVPSLQHSQTMMNLGQTFTGLPPVQMSSTTFSAPKPSFGSIPSVNNNVPARPSSTPLTSSTAATANFALQPVKTHQTGTNNPFGPVSAPPPVPKPPTLFELSTGMYGQNQDHQQAGSLLQQSPQDRQLPKTSSSNPFNFAQSSLNPGASDISSVASSFAFTNGNPPTNSSANLSTFQPRTATSTTGPGSPFSTAPSSQPTGVAGPSHLSSTTPFVTRPTSPISPVNSHITGLTGLKPFKPTSSFGTSLLESLPPVAGSGPTTPTLSGNNNSVISPTSKDHSTTQSSMADSSGYLLPSSNLSFLSNQPTGSFRTRSTLGVGLRPQLTGGGAANPFRASMAAGTLGGNAVPPMPHLPGLAFGGMGSSNQSQQPNAATSLI